MADESNVLPPSRIVRWMLLGVVIFFAIGLYFRSGTKLPTVGPAPADTTTPLPAPAR
ncbi:MAG TPA: hypothetical protein VGQ06_00010 [Gemmatimonadales bacterium]|jgi:hypothetical protein|nr:hypothetical protein [Gemmatimonadales bacterium]